MQQSLLNSSMLDLSHTRSNMSILCWASTKDPPVANNGSINGVPKQPKQKTKQINNTTITTKIAQSKTNILYCSRLTMRRDSACDKHRSKIWQLNSNFIDKNNDTAWGFYTGTIAWIIAVAPDSLETYSDREYYQLLTFVHKKQKHKQEKHNIVSLQYS